MRGTVNIQVGLVNNNYLLRFVLDNKKELFTIPVTFEINGQKIISPLTDRWIQDLTQDIIREVYKSDLMGQAITLDWKQQLYSLVCEISGVAR